MLAATYKKPSSAEDGREANKPVLRNFRMM
jgi:hypothetical protein